MVGVNETVLKESEPHAGKMSKNRRQTGAAYAAWALGWDALVQLTTLRNPDLSLIHI